MNAIVVVDDEDARNPLAKRIHHFFAGKIPCEIVSISQFLLRAGVGYDQEVGLTLPLNSSPAAMSNTVVFNRVVEISDTTLRSLDNGSGIVHAGSVSRVLFDVLNDYGKVLCRPGMLSPVGDAVPLNVQWMLVRKSISAVSVPHFAIAQRIEDVDLSAFKRAIYKHASDPHNWRSISTSGASQRDLFVVDKPIGIPVILAYFADNSIAFPLYPASAITEETRQSITSFAPILREIFRADVAEALFYVSASETVYAGLSLHVRSAISWKRHRGFDPLAA